MYDFKHFENVSNMWILIQEVKRKKNLNSNGTKLSYCQSVEKSHFGYYLLLVILSHQVL